MNTYGAVSAGGGARRRRRTEEEVGSIYTQNLALVDVPPRHSLVLYYKELSVDVRFRPYRCFLAPSHLLHDVSTWVNILTHKCLSHLVID